MFNRIFLFLLTNLAVMFVLGFFLNVVLPAFGIVVPGSFMPMIIAVVFGMGGAFISLAMSKSMAIRSTGAEVITQPRTDIEQWLVATVKRQAQQAGIGMPEVAIFPSNSINAFATGMNKNSSLVAVSTGLLNSMNREEAEAVLGHEVSHIANGDMVTLTLIQGVLNTLVFFLASIIGRIVDNALSGGRSHSGSGIGYFVVSMFAQFILGIVASIIVFWFSRQREFRADAGGAKLAGKTNMISALERIQEQYSQPSELPGELVAFGISGEGGLSRLFASHPPLPERIEKLKRG